LQAENIPVFLRPGRKDLLVYQDGETGFSQHDKSAQLERPAQLKRTADDTLGSVVKKPRLDENIPVVQIPYRKDLLAYQDGETGFSQHDKLAQLERPAQLKRTADDTLGSAAKMEYLASLMREDQIMFGESSWPKNIRNT
jgi:hypothetical protein